MGGGYPDPWLNPSGGLQLLLWATHRAGLQPGGGVPNLVETAAAGPRSRARCDMNAPRSARSVVELSASV